MSVDTFRKRHEALLLHRLADEILHCLQPRVAIAAHGGNQATTASARDDLAEVDSLLRRPTGIAMIRRFGPYPVNLTTEDNTSVVVDCGPVEGLTDVHVVVSSENNYLMPARPFSNSLSGGLRKAAELRGSDGRLEDDVIGRELAQWLIDHGVPGGPVDPGVVAVTSPGALRRSGILAILHAAVVVPRTQQYGYDVERASIIRAVPRCFDLARQICDEHAVTDRAMSFPLFGAGNGGLTVEEASEWLWSALVRELVHDPAWRIHITTWTPQETRAVLAILAQSIKTDP